MKVHGLLLLDKPLGLSSNTALQKVKRLLGADKAGHGGTLDPMASGVLPLMFGEACKLAGAALTHDKAYEAEVCFVRRCWQRCRASWASSSRYRRCIRP